MNYSGKFKFAEIDGDSLEFNAGVNADIKEVAANALAHAKTLLSHWLEGKFEGDEFVALNPSRDDGKPGSFKINVKSGRWSDFATGESGGDIVSYYAHVNSLKDNCAYPQQEAANRIARDLAELAKNGRLDRCLDKEQEPVNCKVKPDYASVLWHTADEITLLSMIPYLKGRGIGGASNSKEADVRLHGAVPDGDVGRPALIFACREQPGHKLRAIQRIYLSDDLSAKASIKVPKRALGAYKGCAIWLGSETDTLVIVEGPEDGLSLREAGCSFVACAITAGNLANLAIPAAVKRVVLFQDNDEAGEKGAKTAAAKYASQGLEALIAKPPLPIKDANDLLRERGADAVKQAIADPKRFVLQTENVLQGRSQSGSSKEKDRDFITDAKGNIVATNKHNIRLAIEKLGASIRWNEFTHQPFLSTSKNPKPCFMSDDDFVDLRLEIQENFLFLPSKDYFIDVVKNIARANKFHPVRERFNALQWDGEARIDEFFITYAGAEDTELNRAVSRKFFIAGICRIYQSGCKFETMLVLEGDQGTGKSTLFKLLAMLEEFFSDDFPLGGDAKQTIEQTRGKFLIECAELKGMKASDVTKVKAQLSRTHDYARLAYDRVASEVPRQFLLAGTTNNKKYLKDETGDRRFWPMETGEICLSEITPALVEQLWAEAKVYAEAGEALVIDRSLWKVAAEEQSKRRFENKYVGELEAMIGDRNGFIPTVDVPRALKLSVAQRDSYVLEDITTAMKELGFEKKTIHVPKEWRKQHENEKQWCYVRGDGEKSKRRIFLGDDFDMVRLCLTGNSGGTQKRD
jgi:hypothetical protein